MSLSLSLSLSDDSRIFIRLAHFSITHLRASGPISLAKTLHIRNLILLSHSPSNLSITLKPSRVMKSCKPAGLFDKSADKQYMIFGWIWLAGCVSSCHKVKSIAKMECFSSKSFWVSGLFWAQVPMIQRAKRTTWTDSWGEMQAKMSGHKFIRCMLEALSIPSTIISSSSKAARRSSSLYLPVLSLIAAIHSTRALKG